MKNILFFSLFIVLGAPSIAGRSSFCLLDSGQGHESHRIRGVDTDLLALTFLPEAAMPFESEEDTNK